MKKLVSLSLFLSIALSSCSTDESFEETASQPEINVSLRAKEDPKTWNPENATNSYDQTGKLYYKILNAYYSNPTATNASEAIMQIENIAATFPEFQNMQENPYSSIQVMDINTILNSELNFVNCAALSISAKNNLDFLIENLNTLSDNDSSPYEINTYIIGFESTTNSSTSLSVSDKKQILISTSIIRHNNYLHRQKRNRRWDIHHGVIAAGEGQIESLAKATTNAAVIDILEINN